VKEAAFRIGRGLSRVTESIAAVLLLSIVGFNLAQVIFRYVINDPLSWPEEAMRYFVVWIAFLGSVAALFRGEHMVVDMLAPVIPPGLVRVFHIVVLLCVGTYCFIMAWEGIPLAIRNAEQTSPSSQIPMIWPYLSVGVGGALMLLQVICLLLLPPGYPAMRFKEEDTR
jgi:TRAP-type C4-dicarboxylate transport system permease small subunit